MRQLIVVEVDSLVVGQVRQAEYVGNPNTPKTGEEVQLVAGDMNWTPIGKAVITSVNVKSKDYVLYECEVKEVYRGRQ